MSFTDLSVRNAFDQYDQPENRLTHALVTTLARERRLLRPFLKWLGICDVPALSELSLAEQQIPGSEQIDLEESDSQGLPDACVFNEAGWAVLFECKVQARVSAAQLSRHRRTAIRRGFESPHLVAIAVDRPSLLGDDVKQVAWRDVYRWFGQNAAGSFWAREFVRYMQIFERKMIAKDYGIRGTVTMFDGLRFDSKNPYNYREAKRLIRLLGDDLQGRSELHAMGVDPNGNRRSAITGSEADLVWDYLPLRDAGGADFTSFPHLTLAIHRLRPVAAITIPNGIKGGFRKRLDELGREGFVQLLENVEKRLRPVVRRSQDAKPIAYLLQRHFNSRSSAGEIDAQLEADLRTVVRGSGGVVKYQPEWLNAAFDILTNKRSNMQFGVEVRFSYNCKNVRSHDAGDLFVATWKALGELLSFAIPGYEARFADAERS